MPVTLNCEQHPKYMAILKPRSTCTTCAVMWASVQAMRETKWYGLSWSPTPVGRRSAKRKPSLATQEV